MGNKESLILIVKKDNINQKYQALDVKKNNYDLYESGRFIKSGSIDDIFMTHINYFVKNFRKGLHLF